MPTERRPPPRPAASPGERTQAIPVPEQRTAPATNAGPTQQAGPAQLAPAGPIPIPIPTQRRAPAVEADTVRARPDAPTVQIESVIPGRSRTRSAFSVWAVVFAVGVVVHEWQVVVPLFSLHTLNGILACVVLLRPSAVWRTMLLAALLAVEFVSLLPNPYSHALLMHLSAAALPFWFGVELLRTRTLRPDRGEVFERIAPFLRTAFLLAWFTDAVSKLNSDFIATIGTCAPNVINEIPLFDVPENLYAAVAVATLVLEFGIPTLLLFRVTRSVGIVLALLWYLLIAAGGNPAHSALMLSFVLLFLPTAMLVTAGARLRMWGRRFARPRLRAVATSPAAPLVLAACWLVGLTVNELLPFELAVRLSRWSAIGVTLIWLGLWVYLLVRHRRHWLGVKLLLPSTVELLPPPAPGGDRSTTLRIREGVLVAAFALLIVNSLSPYVGLKTDWSFSQYGNLRTEAGHWNHLVIPEAVRVFETQDRLVRIVHAQGDRELVQFVDEYAGSQFVLLDARRVLADYPYAVVDYEIDGVQYHTDKVGDDPVLGGGVDPVTGLLGRYRLIPLAPTCQF